MLMYYLKWDSNIETFKSFDNLQKRLNQLKKNDRIEYIEYGEQDYTSHIPMVVVKNKEAFVNAVTSSKV